MVSNEHLRRKPGENLNKTRPVEVEKKTVPAEEDIAGPEREVEELGEELEKTVPAEEDIAGPEREVEELGEELEKTVPAEAEVPMLEPLVTFETIPGFEKVDDYWIEEPLSLVTILRDQRTGSYKYHLVEPKLSDFEEKVLARIRETLKDGLPYESIEKEVLERKFSELAEKYGIPEKLARKIVYNLNMYTFGFGKIDSLMKDPRIEDISCDGIDVPIFIYHRKYYNLETNLKFNKEELDPFVTVLAEKCGKHISFTEPAIEARLPDGSRVQATLGVVTTRGASFTIRKFLGATFTPVDLILYGTFTPEMLAYLWIAVENRKNIIVIGGTASGKTSTLNALAFFIPPDAKIVSIEDTRELSLYQQNWVPNVTREIPGLKTIDMHELVRMVVKQRPECLIVGEVRGVEALAMFQAICTGHTAFSTMHAGSVESMVNRLKGEPINLPTPMLAELDVVCLQMLTEIGLERVRRNQQIVEFTGLDPITGEMRIAETFRWQRQNDSFERTGESHVLGEIRDNLGMGPMEMRKELINRERVLRYMAENKITSYGEVASTIRRYHFDRAGVLEGIP